MIGTLKTVVSMLFGGPNNSNSSADAVLDVAKGVGNWIDERNFTEEEKSKADASNLALVLEAVALTRDENSVRSVTRRVLAWAIMGTYLAAFWTAVGYTLLDKDPARLFEIMDAFMLPELALAVGSFYFMVSLLRSKK